MNPPPVFVAIRELGPTLTWVGLVLLAIGAASAALLIFGPAHRRLRTLEQAARALGEGRTDVRAVEAGGDEVSALAHTFNRMADDLGARAAALAASDRARRQLLADVSHELMTPLAAMRGYTETLAMPELKPRRSRRASRYLGIIGDETQKLESLIGDLLDLARLEGGGGTLTLEDVPVKELFSRIADRHGPAIRERHITLDVDVQPPDLTVRGDGQRLEQALQNLAANALRHTPEGGRLSLAAEDDGGRRRASPCATRARAFRPSTCRTFSSASTRRTRREAPPGCPAAASACRSFRPSSSATADRDGVERARTAARSSRSESPGRDHPPSD